jgi:hypothetical protein
MNMTEIASDLGRKIGEHGYAEINAAKATVLLDQVALQDWAHFARSWNDLPLDNFMGDGGVYRRRRFAVYDVDMNGVTRQRHQPHYQKREHNALNGGIDRWFEPVKPPIGSHPIMTGLLMATARVIENTGDRRHSWRAEVHQFRIEATTEQAGFPTPEGLHRDGVDWVVMMLINRHNVRGGISEVYGSAGNRLASFMLETPLDSLVLDDTRVIHGVTPIFVNITGREAHRDIIVITFRETLPTP